MTAYPKLTTLRIDLMRDMKHPAGLDPAALNKTGKKLVDQMVDCGWVSLAEGNYRLTLSGVVALGNRT